MNDIEILKYIYVDIKAIIQERLSEFDSIRERKNLREHFIELSFCLLTPQSSARSASKAIDILLNNKLLFKGAFDEISEVLKLVRFRNNKARYIIEARDKFYFKRKVLVELLFDDNISIPEKRNWLVQNVKGYGYKEASHYLRNIGLGENLAILDRHILKNMKNFGVIDDIPKSITPKIYHSFESLLSDFSDKIKIPMGHLDFLLWYKEAGEVFK